MVNNETLQDGDIFDQVIQEPNSNQVITSTDIEFKPLSMKGLSNFYEEIEEGKREFYAWLCGVEIVCDEDLPDSSWNVHCGRKLYQEVMDYARAVGSND